MICLNINELFYPLVNGTMLSYTIDKTKKFKLNKKQNETTLDTHFINLFLEKNNALKKDVKRKHKNVIKEFTILIHDEFPYAYETLDNKLQNLKIYMKKSSDGDNIGGLYSHNYNIILLSNNSNIDRKLKKTTLTHELFHMASAGFVDNDCKTGDGINEGYTEYLNSKYFNNKHATGYFYLVLYAGILDDIIGSKILEEIYFKTGINGLRKYLSNYMSEEEINDFINNFDSLEGYYEDVRNKEKFGIYVKNINKISLFLLNLKISKDIKENGCVNKSELQNTIKKIRKDFTYYTNDNLKVTINSIEFEELQETLNKYNIKSREIENTNVKNNLID